MDKIKKKDNKACIAWTGIGKLSVAWPLLGPAKMAKGNQFLEIVPTHDLNKNNNGCMGNSISYIRRH